MDLVTAKKDSFLRGLLVILTTHFSNIEYYRICPEYLGLRTNEGECTPPCVRSVQPQDAHRSSLSTGSITSLSEDLRDRLLQLATTSSDTEGELQRLATRAFMEGLSLFIPSHLQRKELLCSMLRMDRSFAVAGCVYTWAKGSTTAPFFTRLALENEAFEDIVWVTPNLTVDCEMVRKLASYIIDSPRKPRQIHANHDGVQLLLSWRAQIMKPQDLLDFSSVILECSFPVNPSETYLRTFPATPMGSFVMDLINKLSFHATVVENSLLFLPVIVRLLKVSLVSVCFVRRISDNSASLMYRLFVAYLSFGTHLRESLKSLLAYGERGAILARCACSRPLVE